MLSPKTQKSLWHDGKTVDPKSLMADFEISDLAPPTSILSNSSPSLFLVGGYSRPPVMDPQTMAMLKHQKIPW
jgi:hypothetical protein